MNTIKYLEKQTKIFHVFLGLALTASIGLIDFLVGPNVSLSIFYVIPLSMITWFIHKKAGFLLAFICIIMPIIINTKLFFYKKSEYYLINLWNIGMQFIFFLIIIFLISKLKTSVKEKEKIIQEKLNVTLKEITVLKSFLPICSSCKKIRDENNQWIDVEVYISHHTKTQFSHGICPDCAKKLYPNIFSN